MYFDYHVHSHFSDDSWYEMEDVIKDAISMGMAEICFTDHVDYGIKPDWTDEATPKIIQGKEIRNVNYPVYFKELDDLQKKYSDSIQIKKGLEFGIQSHTIPPFEKLIQEYPLDFVLLSIHQIGDKEFWYGDFQKDKTLEECYEQYYAEMFDVVQHFHNYSVLAHMDLIRRYLDKDLDYFSQSKEIIETILKYIIQDGKGIEVNTSSYYYNINGLTPSIEILKLYHTLGGEIITVGSDSHKKEQLGAHIHDVRDVLREIGYKYTCTFDKMEPTFQPL